MPKCYGYCRVSTIDQARSGMSIDVQKDLIKRYADYLQAKGFEWAGFYEDPAVSGKKELWSRPAGSKLRAAAERGDAVVFAKLDRGFRNLIDLLTTVRAWREMGVAVHFLDCGLDTSTPVGKLMLTVLGAVAEFQRDRISEVTKEGLDRKRRKGQLLGGGVRYGYKWAGKRGEKRMVPNAKEREVGASIVRWREAGWTWEDIYWHLAKHGVRGKEGNEIHTRSIQRWYEKEVTQQAKEAAAAQQKAAPAGPAQPAPPGQLSRPAAAAGPSPCSPRPGPASGS